MAIAQLEYADPTTARKKWAAAQTVMTPGTAADVSVLASKLAGAWARPLHLTSKFVISSFDYPWLGPAAWCSVVEADRVNIVVRGAMRFTFGAIRPHYGVHITRVVDGPPDPHDLATAFEGLAATWERETAIASTVERIAMHPAYQQIIGMGPAALPFILQRLVSAPSHWFWALVAITRQDVAAGETTVEGATRAWIEWGRAHGYLDDSGQSGARSTLP